MDKIFETKRQLDLDKTLNEIVDIFSLDGVELVRVSGLCRMFQLPPATIETILKRLSDSLIVKYDYKIICPHCGEISYVVKPRSELIDGKLCDTCDNKYLPKVEDNTLVLKNFKG